MCGPNSFCVRVNFRVAAENAVFEKVLKGRGRSDIECLEVLC